MLAELIGFAGSGLAGTIIGLISANQKYKSDERKLKHLRKGQDADKIIAHLATVADKPFYGVSVFMLVATLCTCTVLCVSEPSRVLWTFAPEATPTTFEFWFIKYQHQRDAVYKITTGGVAYALLNSMVFQIGRILSGVR